MVKIEKESAYKKLNGTMSGEEFRQWRANLYDAVPSAMEYGPAVHVCSCRLL